MTTYAEHNDRAGLDHRLIVLACHEARARYIAAMEESEAFCITLYMSKHDTQLRLREAARLRRENDK
jgi:hypothetical protein